MSAPHIPPASYDDLEWGQKLAILRRWRDKHEDIDAIAAAEGIPNLEDSLRQEYGARCPPRHPAKAGWTNAEEDILRAVHRLPHGRQADALIRKLPARTANACRSRAATLGLFAWTEADLAVLRDVIGTVPPVKVLSSCVAALPTRAPASIRKKLAELMAP